MVIYKVYVLNSIGKPTLKEEFPRCQKGVFCMWIVYFWPNTVLAETWNCFTAPQILFLPWLLKLFYNVLEQKLELESCIDFCFYNYSSLQDLESWNYFTVKTTVYSKI